MAISPVQLDYGTVLDQGGKAKIDNVSAAAFGAGHLWTAADEGFSFERLSPKGSGFGDAVTFPLGDYFVGYPPDGAKESDLEGLAFQKLDGQDADRLWLMGSQGLVRKKYKQRKTDDLLGQRPVREAARSLLGFVEVSADGTPAKDSGVMLPLGDEPGSLVACLAEWEELARAAKRPSKENGLDIEGLAVFRDRIFLGLRGPVFGPYAIVLEIAFAIDGRRLEIVPVDGRLTSPHLVDTGGLGIRDLHMHSKGLVVLAGPTLDMDGPFELYLARAPLRPWSPAPGKARDAEFLMELPIERLPDEAGRMRGDRPEGITMVDRRLLVVAERKLPKPRPAQILEAALIDVPELA